MEEVRNEPQDLEPQEPTDEDFLGLGGFDFGFSSVNMDFDLGI